jgi:hypothetical protein
MPGQRRTQGPRARASRLSRLAGFGAIVLVAAGGAVAYVAMFHPATVHAVRPLPIKVVSNETVGLVTEAAGPGSSSGQLLQLLDVHVAPAFVPVPPSSAAYGHPEWQADQMAGGTVIFIYVPSGECLASSGSASHPSLLIQHCQLNLQLQRWLRVNGTVQLSGHDYNQYANAGNGRCISQAGSVSAQGDQASLEPCDPSRPISQLIALWWSES